MKDDVAHALYREDPVGVHYLDHDTVAAARAACDYHVKSGVYRAAQLLSNAWHELHNPMFQPLGEAEDMPQGVFSHYTAPARMRDKLPCVGPDAGYAHFTGEPSYWMLAGQRILQPARQFHPHLGWVISAGGNYRWVHAYGIELCREHLFRFGAAHTLELLLWTLEWVPPSISGCEEWTEPPPVMPEHCKVLEGEYYDSVASYRNLYVQEKQPLLVWTRREHPEWLLRKGVRYELA